MSKSRMMGCVLVIFCIFLFAHPAFAVDPVCGDGKIQYDAGEMCDGGSWCDSTCKFKALSCKVTAIECKIGAGNFGNCVDAQYGSSITGMRVTTQAGTADGLFLEVKNKDTQVVTRYPTVKSGDQFTVVNPIVLIADSGLYSLEVTTCYKDVRVCPESPTTELPDPDRVPKEYHVIVDPDCGTMGSLCRYVVPADSKQWVLPFGSYFKYDQSRDYKIVEVCCEAGKPFAKVTKITKVLDGQICNNNGNRDVDRGETGVDCGGGGCPACVPVSSLTKVEWRNSAGQILTTSAAGSVVNLFAQSTAAAGTAVTFQIYERDGVQTTPVRTILGGNALSGVIGADGTASVSMTISDSDVTAGVDALDGPEVELVVIATVSGFILSSEIMTVPVVATCNNDGVQNNGEAGIDCGGGGCAVCVPVITKAEWHNSAAQIIATGAVGSTVTLYAEATHPHGSTVTFEIYEKDEVAQTPIRTVALGNAILAPLGLDGRVSATMIISNADIAAGADASEGSEVELIITAKIDTVSLSSAVLIIQIPLVCNNNGVKDIDRGETGVDCGGGGCSACASSSISSTGWRNSAGQALTSSSVGSAVNAVAQTTYPAGTAVTFEIYEKDGETTTPVRTSVLGNALTSVVDASGVASVSITITDADVTAGLDVNEGAEVEFLVTTKILDASLSSATLTVATPLVCNNNGIKDIDRGETGIDCGGGGCAACVVSTIRNGEWRNSGGVSTTSGTVGSILTLALDTTYPSGTVVIVEIFEEDATSLTSIKTVAAGNALSGIVGSDGSVNIAFPIVATDVQSGVGVGENEGDSVEFFFTATIGIHSAFKSSLITIPIPLVCNNNGVRDIDRGETGVDCGGGGCTNACVTLAVSQVAWKNSAGQVLTTSTVGSSVTLFTQSTYPIGTSVTFEFFEQDGTTLIPVRTIAQSNSLSATVGATGSASVAMTISAADVSLGADALDGADVEFVIKVTIGSHSLTSDVLTVPIPLVCNADGHQNNGETGVDCGGGGCTTACPAQSISSVTWKSAAGAVAESAIITDTMTLSAATTYQKDTEIIFEVYEKDTGILEPVRTTGKSNALRTTVTDTGAASATLQITLADVLATADASNDGTFVEFVIIAKVGLDSVTSAELSVAVPASCNDNGLQDLEETGIDCGGSGCTNACPAKTISKIEWRASNGAVLTTSKIDDTVTLFAKTTYPKNTVVTFEIYDDDPAIDDEIRSVAKNNMLLGTVQPDGTVSVTWKITKDDIANAAYGLRNLLEGDSLELYISIKIDGVTFTSLQNSLLLPPPLCGNNVREGSVEKCDGTDIAGCSTGQACDNGCQCVAPTCNNNAVCDSSFENNNNCPFDCQTPIPTAENVLCLYNGNSETSKSICDYYLTKRTGSSSLDLAIPSSAWLSSDRYEKETMAFDKYLQYIYNPLHTYIKAHPEKKITHLAIAKDLPIRIVFSSQNQGLDSSGSSASYSLNFVITIEGDYALHDATKIMNSAVFVNYDYHKRLKHFDPSSITETTYKDNNNQILPVVGKPRFVASHLIGYTLEDVKKMIDKAVATPPDIQKVSWLVDSDSDGWGVTPSGLAELIPQSHLDQVRDALRMSGISTSNIILDRNDVAPVRSPQPLIAIGGQGVYHATYGGSWMSANGVFDAAIANRALILSYESYNAWTFTGDTTHYLDYTDTVADRGDGVAWQGRLADAFTPVALGGSSYSKSFTGAIGHVEEPSLLGAARFDKVFTAYVSDLTLAETFYYLESRGVHIAVGDPILRISDSSKNLLASTLQCETNAQCASGICSADLFGVKRCHPSANKCMLPNEIVEIEHNQYSCANNEQYGKCNNGIWEMSSCVSPKKCAAPLNVVISDVNHVCLLSNGNVCASDGECASGNCDADIAGVKRCHTVANNCVLDSFATETFNGLYACSDADNKRLCTNSVWGTTVSCAAGCSNGRCEGDLFISPNKFIFNQGEKYSIVLPMSPASKSVDQIFTSVPATMDLQLVLKNSNKKTSFEFGEWSSKDIISDGESLYLSDIIPGTYTQIIPGVTHKSPISVQIKGRVASIGVPYCASSYTASKVLSEIAAKDARCTVISQTPISQGPVEYWSTKSDYVQSGIKKDFQIKRYESYTVMCDSQTDIVWTPTCPPQTVFEMQWRDPVTQKPVKDTTVGDSVQLFAATTLAKGAQVTFNVVKDNPIFDANIGTPLTAIVGDYGAVSVTLPISQELYDSSRAGVLNTLSNAVNGESLPLYFDIKVDSQKVGESQILKVTPGVVNEIQTVSDLLMLAQATNNAKYRVAGYHSPNDGGGGLFIYDQASTETPDAGVILEPIVLNSGRFKRQYSSLDSVRAEWFGAYGDGLHADQTAINAALKKFSRVSLMEKTYGVRGTPVPYGLWIGSKNMYSAPLSDPTDWKHSTDTLPENLAQANTLVINDVIYLFGGYTDSGVTDSIYTASVSDPTNWRKAALKLPAKLRLSHLAVIGDNIYLFGGNVLNVNNEYNDVSTIWRASKSNPLEWIQVTGKNLPSPVSNGAIAVVKDRVYIFGGASTFGSIYSAPLSDPVSWTRSGSLPINIMGGRVAVVDKYVYIFGGTNAENKIYRASIDTPTIWTLQSEVLPQRTVGGSLIVAGDVMYLYGGVEVTQAGSIYLDTIQHAPLSNPLHWTKSSSILSKSTSYAQAVVAGNKVIIMGGLSSPVAHSIGLKDNYIIEGADKQKTIVKLLDETNPTMGNTNAFSVFKTERYYSSSDNVQIRKMTVDANYVRQDHKTTLSAIQIRGGNALAEDLNIRGYGTGYDSKIDHAPETFALGQSLLYKHVAPEDVGVDPALAKSRKGAIFRRIDFTGVGHNADVGAPLIAAKRTLGEVTHVLIGGSNNFDNGDILLPDGKVGRDPQYDPLNNGENENNWWPSYNGEVYDVNIHDEVYSIDKQVSALHAITAADTVGVKIHDNTVTNYPGTATYFQSWWTKNTEVQHNKFENVHAGIAVLAFEFPEGYDNPAYKDTGDNSRHTNMLFKDNTVTVGKATFPNSGPAGVIIYGGSMNGMARRIQVRDTTAYIADSRGLEIVDVTIKTAPKRLGLYDTNINAYGVDVIDKTAYVASRFDGLHIIDVTNKASPTLLGKYKSNGDSTDVVVVNKIAYLSDGVAGVTLIDVSDPRNPKKIGGYNTPHLADSVNDVAINSNLAYVANGSGGLLILDVTSPSSPALKSSTSLSGVAKSVVVSGQLAYVAAGASGLLILDISIPSAPKLIGSAASTGVATDVQVVGTTAYVADGPKSLKIFDVSVPASPKLIGIMDPTLHNYAQGVFVDNGIAYLADGNSGVRIINVQNAASPTQLSQFYIQSKNQLRFENIIVEDNTIKGSEVATIDGHDIYPSGVWFAVPNYQAYNNIRIRDNTIDFPLFPKNKVTKLRESGQLGALSLPDCKTDAYSHIPQKPFSYSVLFYPQSVYDLQKSQNRLVVEDNRKLAGGDLQTLTVWGWSNCEPAKEIPVS